MRKEGLPMLKEACWTGVLAAALLVAGIVWWIASPAPADAQFHARSSARRTASGSLSMTISSTRAGPSGRFRSCSQSRNVPGAIPKREANSV